jgi:epoxyqueuosine reductase QueG
MNKPSLSVPSWLTIWMQDRAIPLWGGADLHDFSTPGDSVGQGFDFALSWAIPMNPHIMEAIQQGPNQAYADEYARVNALINQFALELAKELQNRGFRAHALAASERTDITDLKGDFPHKTAATRAGLGWIGRHCQLITREFGSWVRLGTVFSDLEFPCGIPLKKSYCGKCTRCVDACPANALHGAEWLPGMPREKILDVHACDKWKKQHYYKYHQGHNCGICSAVCPYGLKVLKQGDTSPTISP